MSSSIELFPYKKFNSSSSAGMGRLWSSASSSWVTLEVGGMSGQASVVELAVRAMKSSKVVTVWERFMDTEVGMLGFRDQNCSGAGGRRDRLLEISILAKNSSSVGGVWWAAEEVERAMGMSGCSAQKALGSNILERCDMGVGGMGLPYLEQSWRVYRP